MTTCPTGGMARRMSGATARTGPGGDSLGWLSDVQEQARASQKRSRAGCGELADADMLSQQPHRSHRQDRLRVLLCFSRASFDIRPLLARPRCSFLTLSAASSARRNEVVELAHAAP